MNSLPRIDARYWLTLMAASVFGTNTGDFVSDTLHIGHLVGLPWLVGLLVVILWLDRVLPLRAPIWFWAAIITVRTAATNIGDAFHDFGIGFAISLPLVSAALVLAIVIYWRRGGGVRQNGTMRVDWKYWLCMVLAGAWGTIAGDFTSFGITHPPLFPPVATAVLCLPLGLLFLSGGSGRLLRPGFYWATVAMIRAAGTCAGDALAQALGGRDHLLPSTALTGAMFIGLVLAFYVAASRRQRSDYP